MAVPTPEKLLRLIGDHPDADPARDDMADAMSMVVKYRDHKVYGAVPSAAVTSTTSADKVKATKEKRAVAGGDPTGWKMTSVRWLRENHPIYASIHGKTAHGILSNALAMMSYCEA